MVINMRNATEIHKKHSVSIIFRFGGFLLQIDSSIIVHVWAMLFKWFLHISSKYLSRVVHAHFVPRCM